MRSVHHAPTALAVSAPRRASGSAQHRAARPAVHDHVALDEIELYAELMIAAQRSEERLSAETIDTVLGLGPSDAVGD